MIFRLVLLGLFLLNINAYAQIAAGGKLNQTKSAITLGDFHTFNLLGPDIWGLERYGVGRGQFDIQSDRVGIFGDSRSGTFLAQGNGLKLGIEPANGSVGYHDKPEYQWEPGFSIGLKEIRNNIGFYAGSRIGLSYNNTTNDKYNGIVLQIQLPKVNMTYWENDYKHMPPLKIYDLNILNKVNIQQRYEKGDSITMIGVKFEI